MSLKQRKQLTSVIISLEGDDCGGNSFARNQGIPIFAHRPTFSQNDGQRGQIRDCYETGDDINDPLPLFYCTKDSQQ